MNKQYNDTKWQESMRIKFDYNNMLDGFIGGGEGITNSEIDALNSKAEAAYNTVMKNRGSGMMGWSELPYNQTAIVEDLILTAKDVREKFDSFVVFGIGGSALGPIAIYQALCHLHHNELPKEKRNAPKFYVEDNVDPERMAALFDVIDPEKTCFNVITKSGATSETMAQYLIVLDTLKKKLGNNYKSNIIATTSESRGNLIKIAKSEGFKTFYIPDGVGGRFSVTCPVGLLAAAVLGIDIKEMLAGCAYMDELSKIKEIRKNPALVSAVLQYIAFKKGKNVSVMMPYADSLRYIADWYCQLWAESLGKAVDKSGKTVHAGQTPVKALGVTDQHSQVQLYTEGPFDKVTTFIAVEKYRNTYVIPHGVEDIHDVSFLGGHTMNELINAERVATEYALTRANRLNNTIILPEVNAFTIGELLYYYEMETAFIGEMLGIDTYNQPGVEAGKQATFALLGKEGYDEKRTELKNAPKKDGKYIV